ncbi:DUF192 domain-containing protein [Acidithiobacillus sp.]
MVLAAGFWDRLQGLLGKSALHEEQGLLLMPCASVHTWGMRFSLDIVFLDREQAVLACHEGVKPYGLKSCRGAWATLEVAAGSIARLGIVEGQRLEWSSIGMESAA